MPGFQIMFSFVHWDNWRYDLLLFRNESRTSTFYIYIFVVHSSLFHLGPVSSFLFLCSRDMIFQLTRQKRIRIRVSYSVHFAGTFDRGCYWSGRWNSANIMGTATSFGSSSDNCIERQTRKLVTESTYNVVSCWSRNPGPYDCLNLA